MQRIQLHKIATNGFSPLEDSTVGGACYAAE